MFGMFGPFGMLWPMFCHDRESFRETNEQRVPERPIAITPLGLTVTAHQVHSMAARVTERLHGPMHTSALQVLHPQQANAGKTSVAPPTSECQVRRTSPIGLYC